MKSFVTTEEHQTCHGRYNDVKLAKNCCRAYAANDIQEEDEPRDDTRLSITMEEFLTLLRRTFPGDKPADIRAVLKRTVVFVFGKSALYLRLPSQQDDAPIHRIKLDNIHEDLLAEHDKLSYGKYKSGLLEKPSGYEDAIAKEQCMISQGMAKYSECATTQDYVTKANAKLYDIILHKQPIPEKAWLPSSPSLSSPERPAAPIYKDPLPGTVPKRFVNKFVYPTPTKRVRGKTPGTAQEDVVASAVELGALELADDFEADAEAAVADDFEADEEAAMHMDFEEPR